MAKYLDLTGLQHLWTALKGKFVLKESGKGLSTNDYTTTEKTKLGGISTGAQVNVLESVKVNGVAQAISSKAVNLDLTGYALKSDITTVYKYKGSVANYASLPSTNNAVGDTYNTEDTGINYSWTGTAWDSLGATVDLSAYALKTDTIAITTAEIDTIIAS